MPQLDRFENYNVFHSMNAFTFGGNGSLYIQGQYIPGDISMGNVILLRNHSGTTAKTLSVSFGLYSLNGSTLSLANSASHTSNPVAAGGNSSWITFDVSNTSYNITPGNWYFGVVSSTSSNSRLSLFGLSRYVADEAFVGIFVSGRYSASVTALPASIATSDCTQPNGTTAAEFPYVLISA